MRSPFPPPDLQDLVNGRTIPVNDLLPVVRTKTPVFSTFVPKMLVSFDSVEILPFQVNGPLGHRAWYIHAKPYYSLALISSKNNGEDVFWNVSGFSLMLMPLQLGRGGSNGCTTTTTVRSCTYSYDECWWFTFVLMVHIKPLVCTGCL